jgi:hypothetical protein
VALGGSLEKSFSAYRVLTAGKLISVDERLPTINALFSLNKNGGAKRDRTADLLHAILGVYASGPFR